MGISKNHLLYTLLLLSSVYSQILFPTNYCLGTCSSCQPSNLVECKGETPCEWGYYQSKDDCLIQPSLKLISTQLGQRIDNTTLKLKEGWVGNSSLSVCHYSSVSGDYVIDVLGFFTGESYLQKTFEVDSNSQLFQLSFNLVRDQWLPFSDFLAINISSQAISIESLSISYGTRIKVDSQSTSITCSGKSVISEKINIKILNNKGKTNQLTVSFKSFLFSSMWGLTNIKLIEGCVGSFIFDFTKGTCIPREANSSSNLNNSVIGVNSTNPTVIKSSSINSTQTNIFTKNKQIIIQNENNTAISQTNQSSVNILINQSNKKAEDTLNQATNQLSCNINYIPVSISSQSGLKLSVTASSIPQALNLVAKIDKLQDSQYQITHLSQQNNILTVFVSISQSFVGGLLILYNNQSQTLSPIGSISVDRFDSVSCQQLQSIQTFSIFFQIFSWIGILLIILCVLVGWGVVMEQYVIVLQIIFLHVYIVPNYLPLSFRDCIGGLNRIINLNFIPFKISQMLQQLLIGSVVQSGPIRFSIFSKGINFSRAFYPLLIINIVYVIWFLILGLLNKYLVHKPQQTGQYQSVLLFVDKITSRVVNFVDMIWRYQFLATFWLCFIQFINFKYPDGTTFSQIMNGIFCIASFSCSLIWPLFSIEHCRQSYYEIIYSAFRLKFSDIYFGKITEHSLPSIHHRMGYPIFKTVRIIMLALVIAYLGESPINALSILVLINSLQIFYCYLKQIFVDELYFLLKSVENVLLITLDISLLFISAFNNTASSEQFINLGYFLSTISLLIIVNALARVFYIFQKKYCQFLETKQQEINDAIAQKMVM